MNLRNVKIEPNVSQRLRALHSMLLAYQDHGVLLEAADLIERLRERVDYPYDPELGDGR
jgi:hypothetical protein